MDIFDTMSAILLPLAFALTLAAVPPSLAALERIAEDIDDAVVAQDWPKVTALEEEGDRALATRHLATPAGAHGAAARALSDAKAATQRRETLPTRRAANRLAAAVVEFYEPLHPTVPTSVMRLDVLLRQLELAAAAGNAAEARTTLGNVTSIWTSISTRTPVTGSHAARTFARQLGAIHRALAAGRLNEAERKAVSALEGVDGLEKIYESTVRKRRPS